MRMRGDKGDSGIFKNPLTVQCRYQLMPCADCYYSIFSKMQPK